MFLKKYFDIKIALVVCVLSMIGMCLYAQGRTDTPTTRDTVLVEIGDSYFTAADIREKINSFPVMHRSRYKSIDGQKQLLEMMVTEELFYKKALAAGYPYRDDVQDAIHYALGLPVSEMYFAEIIDREVKVTPTEVRKYYDDNIEIYRLAPRTTIIHLQADESDVVAIQTAIANGADFEELIETYSKNIQTKRNRGLIPSIRSIGAIPGIGSDADLDEYITNAKVDENIINGPFETITGIHFFKKTSYTPESIRPFDDVATEIENHLRNQKQDAYYRTFINELRHRYNVVINSDLLDAVNIFNLTPEQNNLIIVESSHSEVKMTLGHLSGIIRQAATERIDVNNKEVQLNLVNEELNGRLIYAAAQEDNFISKNKDNYQIKQTILETILRYYYQENIVRQTSISEEEILDFYHENNSRYTTPVSRDIRQFIAKDEKAAKKHRNDIQKMLRRNQEDRIVILLRKESLFTENDGLIVNIYQNNIIPGRGVDEEYNRKVWELDLAQVSEIFTDKDGNIIFFYIVKENPSEIRPYESVQTSLRNMLHRNKVNELFEQKKQEYSAEYGVTYHYDRLVSFISPEELFTIAEEAQKRYAYGEAINTFEQIINDFPGSQDAYRAMFMKAFITAEELKDTEKGIQLYQDMIDAFPDGELNESAEFMIETLRTNMPIESILE